MQSVHKIFNNTILYLIRIKNSKDKMSKPKKIIILFIRIFILNQQIFRLLCDRNIVFNKSIL